MKHHLLTPLRLLMVALCMLGIAAEGQEVEFNNLIYTLNPDNKTAKLEMQFQLYGTDIDEVTIEPYVTYEGETYTVTEIGTAAFGWMDFIKKINLPETLKKIGESAFSTTGIESMIIPNSVDTIMQNAFQDCEYLKTCKLPNNLKVIPGGLFYRCHSLESIEIPNSVTRFCREWSGDVPDYDAAFADDAAFFYTGRCAFYECTKLETVILPKVLSNIPLSTFEWCTNLKHVEVPHSIYEIGHCAFDQCTALEEFEIPENITIWGACFIASGAQKYIKSYHENPIPGFMFINMIENTDFWPRCTFYVPKGLSGIYRNTWEQLAFAPIIEATPVELTSEWRTFCAYEDLDFSGVEGLEVYIAKEYQDGKVLMEPIEQVPAGTGIVLKGTPGFYEIPYANQLEPVDNLLVGLNYGERIAAETEDGNCNLFFNDATEMASLFYGPEFDTERAPALNDEGDQPAFEPADGAHLPYHRAYLQLPASEAGKTVEMVFGNLTGIDNVTAAPTTDGPIYNLQGQRVTNPGPGIYIQNGRKFVVR